VRKRGQEAGFPGLKKDFEEGESLQHCIHFAIESAKRQ